ncbi:MAG: sensor histidine kinase [Nocardioidaceae bacterium]
MSGRRERQRLLDVGLAVTVLVVGVAEVWVPFSSRQGSGAAWPSTLSVVMLAVPLAWRRTRPLAVTAVVLVVMPLAFAVTPVYVLFFGQFVPVGIAVFSVARHGRGREPLLGAAVAACGLVVVDLTTPALQQPGEIVFHWGVFVLVWGAGYGLARQERRARAHLQRAIDTEVAAAGQTMAAVVEERTRIARELHDIVAHSVSMMVVQAGAAEQVVDEDPAYVRTALATIRTTGTGALAEMRRVVAMLRDTDVALAPQPGVDGLPALVDDARGGGLDASLVVDGAPRPLPVGLDLAAYRIVQEALSNVRRHAAASRVSVRLTYGPDDVRIEVVDDGVGGDHQPGHGLIGMRERAALYGGRVETESGRGFTVRAVLPVAAP